MARKGRHGGIIGWGRAGVGKYNKRKLHKAQRRAVKNELRGISSTPGLARWMSEVNWKRW